MTKRLLFPGAMLLISVFSILILVIFTVFTLTTAVNHRSLAQKLAASSERYYAADKTAARIYARLAALGEDGALPTEAEGVALSEERGEKGRVVSYRVPVSESEELEVRVRLSDGEPEVLFWALVYLDEWIGDDNLPVWGGD